MSYDKLLPSDMVGVTGHPSWVDSGYADKLFTWAKTALNLTLADTGWTSSADKADISEEE